MQTVLTPSAASIVLAGLALQEMDSHVKVSFHTILYICIGSILCNMEYGIVAAYILICTAVIIVLFYHTDVNECEVFGDNQLCEQQCINTFGSFECRCIAGYRLAANLVNCTGTD